MKISLYYNESDKNLGRTEIDRGQFSLYFDKADIYINERFVKAQIVAEIVLHELNEVAIGESITKNAEIGRLDKFLSDFAHNLNADSLNEFEPQIKVKDFFKRRNSDKLANIDEKDHRKVLKAIRKAVYGKTK